MLTIFFRTLILYGVSVAAMRLMGKREIGQLQPYELVAAILIADLVAEPMSGAETPLLYGVVPVAALVLTHSVAGVLGMKWPAFRRLLNGSARVLVANGSICYDELRRVCMPVSDLLEAVRANGIMNISEAGTVVLETNGMLSVFPRAAARPATPEDLGLAVAEDALPEVLIADGDYRQKALQRCGLSRAALDGFLHSQGIARGEEVLLCSLDSTGTVFLQPRGAGAQARRVPWKGARA